MHSKNSFLVHDRREVACLLLDDLDHMNPVSRQGALQHCIHHRKLSETIYILFHGRRVTCCMAKTKLYQVMFLMNPTSRTTFKTLFNLEIV